MQPVPPIPTMPLNRIVPTTTMGGIATTRKRCISTTTVCHKKIIQTMIITIVNATTIMTTKMITILPVFAGFTTITVVVIIPHITTRFGEYL